MYYCTVRVHCTVYTAVQHELDAINNCVLKTKIDL